MQDLRLEQTKTTPKIHLSQGHFQMLGDAIPENPRAFYAPILDWIENYKKSSFAKNTSKQTNFLCDVNYFNTGSRGFILEILAKLNTIYKTGHQVNIEWKYAEEEDYQEIEADFKELIEGFTLPIKFVPTKN